MKKRVFLPAVIAVAAIAAALRTPTLGDRPMHADEAIYAFKLGILLESGSWKYDPGEYHGPLLHYLTAAIARGDYRDLTETRLRIVPAMMGIIVALMPLTLAGRIGHMEALAASALTAVSPAMVYWSRYYIPEMLLICLTAFLMAVGLRWPWAAGILAGLMFGAKETAVIAGASMLIAWRGSGFRLRRAVVPLLVSAVAIIVMLGPQQTLESLNSYVRTAAQAERHVHPWHYYLGLILRRETLVVALAMVGAVASFRGTQSLPRFLAIYTLTMTVIYSLIPYKTPWCLLGFLHGMLLLAGVGLAFLFRASQPAALAVVVLGGLHLAYSDAASSYAYTQTSRDIYAVRDRLRPLAHLPVQVISSGNVWPLPWYLRDFTKVEYRRAVTGDMKPAPVILATPDVEPALLHHLYEALPPGQRPLYVPLFETYRELRPGFELRGYVQQAALMEVR